MMKSSSDTHVEKLCVLSILVTVNAGLVLLLFARNVARNMNLKKLIEMIG